MILAKKPNEPYKIMVELDWDQLFTRIGILTQQGVKCEPEKKAFEELDKYIKEMEKSK